MGGQCWEVIWIDHNVMLNLIQIIQSSQHQPRDKNEHDTSRLMEAQNMLNIPNESLQDYVQHIGSLMMSSSLLIDIEQDMMRTRRHLFNLQEPACDHRLFTVECWHIINLQAPTLYIKQPKGWCLEVQIMPLSTNFHMIYTTGQCSEA